MRTSAPGASATQRIAAPGAAARSAAVGLIAKAAGNGQCRVQLEHQRQGGSLARVQALGGTGQPPGAAQRLGAAGLRAHRRGGRVVQHPTEGVAAEELVARGVEDQGVPEFIDHLGGHGHHAPARRKADPEELAHVHVSGHPGRPELKVMYDWIRPELLVPVHGERRHMAEQARFGLACGIPNALVQSNGDVVRLAPGEPKIIGHERTGRLVLDGDVILPADGGTITERRRIGIHGVIAVAVVLDARGKLAVDPEFRLQGVPVEEDRNDFLEEAEEAVERAIEKGAANEDALREALRLGVRRVATEWTGKKPIVEIMLMRLG